MFVPNKELSLFFPLDLCLDKKVPFFPLTMPEYLFLFILVVFMSKISVEFLLLFSISFNSLNLFFVIFVNLFFFLPGIMHVPKCLLLNFKFI